MTDFLRQSLLFPVIQSVHLLGLTVLVGTIALVDLRVLNLGMRRHSVAGLASALAPWTSAGLFTVLITGPLMFWADVPRYLNNPAFVLKMVLFGAAVATHFTMHRRGRISAVLSLLLWSAVVLAGRAIADFDIRPV
jgi:hypothetical protein